MEYWTNSGNFVPNPALDQFQITNQSYTGVWTSLYQNLTNFNNLQVSAAADPTLGDYQAIAMIMKVYDFEQLVDQFGDVPYSQAFNPTKYLNPAYDAQLAIYNDFTKQLDAAIALAVKGGTNPGSADIVFGGVMANWIKFANTLKLRIVLRQSTHAPNAAAVADLSTTSSYGYLDNTIDAEAQPGYLDLLSNGASQASPFYSDYGFDVTGNSTPNNTYYRASNFYISLLTNDNDPRLNQVYSPAAGTTIQGNTFGQVGAAVLSNSFTAGVGPGIIISPTMNAVLIGHAQACFMQAEALQNNIGLGTGASFASAQAAYQAGITSSFVDMQVGATPAASQAAAATYYGQNIANIGWAASTNKEEAIIYQEWFSLFGYGNLEAYLNYERTGYPILPNPLSLDPSAVSTIAPIRQYYPLSEEETNQASVAKEGTINIFTTKIFWEK